MCKCSNAPIVILTAWQQIRHILDYNRTPFSNGESTNITEMFQANLKPERSMLIHLTYGNEFSIFFSQTASEQPPPTPPAKALIGLAVPGLQWCSLGSLLGFSLLFPNSIIDSVCFTVDWVLLPIRLVDCPFECWQIPFN